MAAEKGRPRSPIPLSGLLVLALAGTVLLFEPSLRSRRPESPDAAWEEAGEDIRGRLWEDPFRPILDHLREQEKAGAGANAAARLSEGQARELLLALQIWAVNEGAGLILLPVMVQGGPSAEQVERRIRARRAVVTGLGVRGWVPDRPEHIGFLRTEIGHRIDAIVPFEWFRREALVAEKNAEVALVLWLDESLFAHQPLSELRMILRRLLGYRPPRIGPLAQGAGPLGRGPLSRVRVALIGPGTSGTLRAMLTEDEGVRSEDGAGERQAAAPASEREHEHAMAEDALAALAHELVERLDDYLDRNLPESLQRDRLEALLLERIKAAETARGLELALVAEVRGSVIPQGESDPSWAENVVASWLEARLGRLTEARGPRFAAALRARSLVTTLDGYLDDGIPEEVDQEELLARLTELLASVPAGNRAKLREVIRTTLQEKMAGVEDSNPEWASAVAESWLGQAESGSASADEYGSVMTIAGLAEALVARLDSYLDEGLPAEPGRAKLEERIQAVIRQSAGTTRLEQDLLVALRSELKEVQDQDSNWAQTVVDGFIEKYGSLLQGEIRPIDAHLLPEIGVTSSRATAPLEVVQRNARGGCLQQPATPIPRVSATDDKLIGDCLPLANPIPRVPATDDKLIGELIEELGRRNVDLCESGSVVVIGEWDTLYGRTLSNWLEASIRRSCEGLPPGTTWADLEKVRQERIDQDAPRRVQHVPYLRGLDGVVAGRAKPKGQKSSEKDEEEDQEAALRSPFKRDTRLLEYPTGASQLDYVRRLAGRLAAGAAGDSRQIRAIGIFGSDVYDKLLLLQGLKKRFPNAIFFTTDLDARLLHPAEFRWAQNLLVASSFGLELNDRFQGGMPPFRDSYQTSTFFATQLAISPEETRDWQECVPPPVMLFEIGRGGAFRLATKSENGSPAGRSAPECEIHPAFEPPAPSWRTFGLLSLMGITTLVLFVPISKTLQLLFVTRRLTAWEERVVNRFLLATVVSFGGLMLLVCYDATQVSAEPFGLFLGLSVWPTEFLRLAACLTGMALVAAAMARIRRSDRELGRGLLRLECLSPGGDRSAGGLLGSFWRWTRELAWDLVAPAAWGRRIRKARERLGELPSAWRQGLRGWFRWHRQVAAEPGADLDVAAAWAEYQWMGRARNRAARVGTLAALFLAASAILLLLSRLPARPVRGDIAWWTDLTLLLAGFLSLVVVTFFVADAALLCRSAILKLAHSKSVWPAAARAAEMESRGVQEAEADVLLDLRFVGRRTEVVGSLIVYPFVVLLLLLLARNRFFEAWDWPPAILLIILLDALLVLLCVVALRRAANEVRTRALERLRLRRSSQSGGDPAAAQRLTQLIEEVQGMDRGAFAHWLRHPIVKALLIPFSGISLVTLLEYLLLGGL